MELLREQVERAGGIWLRVAAYPYPYRSAFNFRFDHDEYDPHDFDATLTAIAGYESAWSPLHLRFDTRSPCRRTDPPARKPHRVARLLAS